MYAGELAGQIDRGSPSKTDQASPERVLLPPARETMGEVLTLTAKVLLAMGLLVVAIELVLRFGVGLGHPPIAVIDPDLEYLMAPNQDVRWRANRIAYNSFSSRSDPFPEAKQDGEHRILMLGDSVINGGRHIGQEELASTLLSTLLASTVANVSAPSWGPGNMLAYARKFGLHNADEVVLVLSSHDVGDNPTFTGTDLPTRPPFLAIEEAGWYAMRLFRPELGSSAGSTVTGLRDLGLLIEEVRHAGARPVIALHLERGEYWGPRKPGHYLIVGFAERLGVETVQLAPAFEWALLSGQKPYRDHIHPTALGHWLIANELETRLRQ